MPAGNYRVLAGPLDGETVQCGHARFWLKSQYRKPKGYGYYHVYRFDKTKGAFVHQGVKKYKVKK